MSLPETLASIMLAALTLYALFGGADYGGGVWDLLARGPRAQAQRDLIHVRDCVAALRLAADHAAALPPVVTVATGRPLLAGHLADGIAALTLRPDAPLPATPPVPALAAHVVSCRPSPEITALGWHPRVGLAEGLRETITWERARIMSPQECLA